MCWRDLSERAFNYFSDSIFIISRERSIHFVRLFKIRGFYESDLELDKGFDEDDGDFIIDLTGLSFGDLSFENA